MDEVYTLQYLQQMLMTSQSNEDSLQSDFTDIKFIQGI